VIHHQLPNGTLAAGMAGKRRVAFSLPEPCGQNGIIPPA
jgi:hypothetical protein